MHRSGHWLLRFATAVVLMTTATTPLTATDAAATRSATPCTVKSAPGRSITVWHSFDAPRTAALQELVTRFSANTGIAVRLRGSSSGDLLIAKLRQTPRTKLPDLAIVPQDAVALLRDGGTSRDVGGCLTLAAGDSVIPVVASTYRMGKSAGALPFAVSTPVLFYNRLAFTRAGLDPDRPPQALEELTRTSRSLVATGGVNFGLAVDTGAESFGSWVVEQWLAQQDRVSLTPANGHTGPARRVNWIGAAATEQLGWLQQMITDRLAVSVGNNNAGSDDLYALASPSRSVGMTLHTSAALQATLDVLTQQPQPGLDLAIGPFPGPGTGGLVGGYGIAFTGAHRKPAVVAAWQFASYALSPEAQSYWAATTGYTPVSREATTISPLAQRYTSDPRFAVAFHQLESIVPSPARSGPAAGPQRELRAVLAGLTRRVISGATISPALRQAAQDGNLILDDYARHQGS